MVGHFRYVAQHKEKEAAEALERYTYDMDGLDQVHDFYVEIVKSEKVTMELAKKALGKGDITKSMNDIVEGAAQAKGEFATGGLFMGNKRLGTVDFIFGSSTPLAVTGIQKEMQPEHLEKLKAKLNESMAIALPPQRILEFHELYKSRDEKVLEELSARQPHTPKDIQKAPEQSFVLRGLPSTFSKKNEIVLPLSSLIKHQGC
jgi:hypothetical protein